MLGVTKSAFCAILALSAALLTAAHGQERREVPEFRVFGTAERRAASAEIHALIESYKAAWRSQDAGALASIHAEDVEWINAYARMFRGREALAHFLEHRLFPAFDPNVSAQESMNMKLISIRHVSDDAAVVHLYTDGARGSSRNDDETLRRTHIHLVLGREGERWTIVHCAIMDAR
jgi:uncharacterized protein (TIGR02246 family)